MGDANLVAENIVSGKSIFGVTGNYMTLVAGDSLFLSADTEVYTSSTSYVKKKEIRINREGTIRVKFTLNGVQANRTAYGRVYKNDVAVGTERIISDGTTQTFSEDFTVAANDLIQLYIHSSLDTLNIKASAFRIYCGPPTIGTVILD